MNKRSKRYTDEFNTIPRLKSENYIKILGFYPLLKKFIISSLFKWGLV